MMLLLIFIYYFKSILSIKDIETVLKPLTEKYFSGNDTMELSSIYEELCHMEKERLDSLKDSVSSAYDKAGEAFDQLPDGEDRDTLQKFAFIWRRSKREVQKCQVLFSQMKEPLPGETQK